MTINRLARQPFFLLAATVAITVLPLREAMAQATFADTWQYSAGLGVFSGPKYPGSKETEVTPFPILSASYGRFIVGALPSAGIPLGAGAYLARTDEWSVGVGIGGEPGKARKESDSARLRGLGDIDGTAIGSLFGNYQGEWWEAKAALLTDLGNKKQGKRFIFDIEGRYSLNERLTLTAGPGFTWADDDYAQTFFGISAAQSARSGRAAYRAKAGVNSVRFNVGASYALTPQWVAGATFTAERLRGDAVNSPITEKKSQNTVGVFAIYSF